MKTLIVYITKYGATGEIAKKMGELFPDGADVYQLKEAGLVNVAEYDTVIVGGSVYAGMLPKAIDRFFLYNKETLKQKKLGLFISCMSNDRETIMKYFRSGFGTEAVAMAVAVEALGSKIQTEKLKKFDRFIIKKVVQREKNEYTEGISTARIDGFVQRMLGSAK